MAGAQHLCTAGDEADRSQGDAWSVAESLLDGGAAGCAGHAANFQAQAAGVPAAEELCLKAHGLHRTNQLILQSSDVLQVRSSKQWMTRGGNTRQVVLLYLQELAYRRHNRGCVVDAGLLLDQGHHRIDHPWQRIQRGLHCGTACAARHAGHLCAQPHTKVTGLQHCQEPHEIRPSSSACPMLEH